MKKYIIYIIAAILLISLAFAAPPIQVNTGDNGLEIESVKYDYAKEDTTFKLHIHVFNKTTGLPVFGDSADCYLHLYNSTGSHILKEEMPFDAGDIFDFTLTIGAGNFTIGQHQYIIQCNTSGSGGFVSGAFEVTPDGNPRGDNIGLLLSLTIFSLAFILIGMYLFFKRKEDHD